MSGVSRPFDMRRTIPTADLGGRGEMAALIRQLDWGETPLGALDEWSPALRAAVDLMLASGPPTVLAWGPEAVVLYNDACVPIVGTSHPAALGRPAPNCSPAIWKVLGPIVERVRSTGEPVGREDEIFSFEGGGRPEERSFIVSASAVPGPTGEVGGVLAILIETTSRVLRERRFRALIERSWDAIATVDAEGKFLYVSPSTERMLGYPPETLVGRSGFELMHPDDLERMKALLAGVVSAPSAGATAEYRYLRKNGDWLWLELAARNLLDDPAANAVVVNFRDITERKLAEDEIQRAQRSRDDLLAVISHDLRNPLNAMAIVANLLLQPSLTEERRSEHVLTLNRLVTQMSGLIRNLLDFAMIERGTLTVSPRSESVASIVAEAIDSLRPLAAEKAIDVRMAVPLEVRDVMADRKRVLQVLANLVDNAVRFTPEGGEIFVRARSKGEWVEIEVRDTGVGVAREDLPFLFDRFWRRKRGPQ
ncbi:MAG: PAS domain-containing sensor histidine kinase, partial [Candidatus Binatia bacterium]